MEPPLPPLPPHLPPLGSNNPFPVLTHEMFCDHCQHTQVIINDLREEMRFILSTLKARGSLHQIALLTFLLQHYISLMIPSLKRMPSSRGSGTDIKEIDKIKDKTGQNRARDRKEREKTSSTVLSDFIGPAHNPFKWARPAH
ncbi:hypothetical protein Tco_1123863 [Tanacetum coccineum]|uniref:Uncharacterized protein n=1 Tax=Tanacetum coccineum TaxID=301880 RepID=A0ABQ5J4J6_9ASTR